MKPCRDIKTIERLIRHHAQMAVLYQQMVIFHERRQEVLKEYIHELNKPGFKISSSYVVAGTTKRSEPVVTTAGDTFTG